MIVSVQLDLSTIGHHHSRILEAVRHDIVDKAELPSTLVLVKSCCPSSTVEIDLGANESPQHAAVDHLTFRA